MYTRTQTQKRKHLRVSSVFSCGACLCFLFPPPTVCSCLTHSVQVPGTSDSVHVVKVRKPLARAKGMAVRERPSSTTLLAIAHRSLRVPETITMLNVEVEIKIDKHVPTYSLSVSVTCSPCPVTSVMFFHFVLIDQGRLWLSHLPKNALKGCVYVAWNICCVSSWMSGAGPSSRELIKATGRVPAWGVGWDGVQAQLFGTVFQSPTDLCFPDPPCALSVVKAHVIAMNPMLNSLRAHLRSPMCSGAWPAVQTFTAYVIWTSQCTECQCVARSP